MQLKKFARRVNRIDTRQIREHGLEILTKLAEEAYANAQNREFDSRERQNWSRLAAYIYALATNDDLVLCRERGKCVFAAFTAILENTISLKRKLRPN